MALELDSLRTAVSALHGVIAKSDDVDQWMRHHDARNETSHTYEASVAERVYRAAHDFVHDARRLLEALESRND